MDEQKILGMLIDDQKKIGSEAELKKGRAKPNKEVNYNWGKKKVIYDMLSQHYVQRKSVVFIVDYDTKSEY